MQVYAYGPGLAWRIRGSLAPDVVAGACCHAQGVPAQGVSTRSCLRPRESGPDTES
jgi:hypothetical protein